MTLNEFCRIFVILSTVATERSLVGFWCSVIEVIEEQCYSKLTLLLKEKLKMWCILALGIFILISLPHLIKVWRTRRLPGPFAWPYIGNGMEVIHKTPIEILEYIDLHLRNCEKFGRFWLGPTLTCITKNRADSEVFLNS